ncbi:MAG: hypothetical protein UIC63_06070, partial [Bacteroidaceae bacterium]|nr:hypothetical protein [Bacteroidaceae bacterium]
VDGGCEKSERNVPELPIPVFQTANFPLVFDFHGFKNPRLFALWASRLFRRTIHPVWHFLEKRL